MPRFYFDIREGDRFVSDEDGTELADLNAAEREAAEVAAEVGRFALPKGRSGDVTVEVRDGSGEEPVLTARVKLEIERPRQASL